MEAYVSKILKTFILSRVPHWCKEWKIETSTRLPLLASSLVILCRESFVENISPTYWKPSTTSNSLPS